MAEVKIAITVEDRASTAFRSIENAFGKFGQACDEARGRALDFVKGLVGFEALKRMASDIKGLAKSFLDAADMTEQYRSRLKILLGSQEEGSRLFKEMADYAAKTPFEFEEIGSLVDFSGVTESYSMLLTHVKNLGEEATSAGDSWTAMADTQMAAVETIDSKISELQAHLDSLQMQLDTNPAIEGATWARQYIDSIFPEAGLHRYLTVHVQYEGSPIMPFSEGMEYVERRLASLPTDTSHTLHFGISGGRAGFSEGIARAGRPAGQVVVNLSPTININGSITAEGAHLARELQARLAEDIESGRSPVLPALRRRYA